MYRFLLVLFACLVLPAYAETECALNADQSGCLSYSGCYFQEQTLMLNAECNKCLAGYYNNNDTHSINQCITCPTSYPITEAGKIPDTNAYADGQSSCPWKCDTNYYKNGDNCDLCPGSSTSVQGSTSISECNCPQNYHKHYTDSPTFDYCFTCGTGAHYDSGTGSCVCDNRYANGIWTTDNNGLRTYSCTCPEGSTPVDNSCTCSNPNYHITGTTDNYVCESCGSHQISQGGTCVCDDGYYGDETACTPCPSGTKVARVARDDEDLLPTSSTQADCRAHSGTKFCDANGQNCMMLLQ